MPELQSGGPDRRNFLKSAAKLGLIVPPAMTFLLTTSMTSKAIAHSSGHGSHGDDRDHDRDHDHDHGHRRRRRRRRRRHHGN